MVQAGTVAVVGITARPCLVTRATPNVRDGS